MFRSSLCMAYESMPGAVLPELSQKQERGRTAKLYQHCLSPILGFCHKLRQYGLGEDVEDRGHSSNVCLLSSAVPNLVTSSKSCTAAGAERNFDKTHSTAFYGKAV